MWLLKDGNVFGANKRLDQMITISAELPDPEDPELFEVISTQMIHGTCEQLNPRSVCMKDRKSSKKYPRGPSKGINY